MGGVQTIRLKPAHKTTVLTDHDVDGVALEFDPKTGKFGDFRIELGRHFYIVWVIPIGPGGRLRSILVDCAVVDVETEVELDPCAFDFGPEEWKGSLGHVGRDGAHEVEYVRIELRKSPPSYECTVDVRDPAGTVTRAVLRGGNTA